MGDPWLGPAAYPAQERSILLPHCAADRLAPADRFWAAVPARCWRFHPACPVETCLVEPLPLFFLRPTTPQLGQREPMHSRQPPERSAISTACLMMSAQAMPLPVVAWTH